MKYFFKVFFLLFGIISSYAQTERVGINTNTPRKTLEVDGSTKVTGTINIGTVNTIGSSDTYTFLMQEPTKTIRALDAATAKKGNALGYFMRFELKNVQNDWVTDFDTGINNTNFTIVVISSRFTKSMNNSMGVNRFAIPIVSAFKSGTTWHLKADYPAVSTDDGSNGSWFIKLLIVSKDLIRTFPNQIETMSGATTGVAGTPVLD